MQNDLGLYEMIDKEISAVTLKEHIGEYVCLGEETS